MQPVTIAPQTLTRDDQMRLALLIVKGNYRKAGLEKTYARLLRELWPAKYPNRAAWQRVHKVWHMQTSDAEIVADLEKALQIELTK